VLLFSAKQRYQLKKRPNNIYDISGHAKWA